jgi:hypothetical protein
MILTLLIALTAHAQDSAFSATECAAKIKDAREALAAAESSSDGQIEACAPAAEAKYNSKALLQTLSDESDALAAAWDQYDALKPQLAQAGAPDTAGNVCAAKDAVKAQLHQLSESMGKVQNGISDHAQNVEWVSAGFDREYLVTHWGSLFHKRPANCQKTKANIAAVSGKLLAMKNACEEQVERGPRAAREAVGALDTAVANNCENQGCASVSVGQGNHEVDAVDMYGRWHKVAGGEMTREEAEDYILRRCDKEYKD